MNRHRQRSTRRQRRLALVALLAAAGTVPALTTAVYTENATVGGNTVASGQIDIAASPGSTALSYAGMMPGDKVANQVTINNNQADSRYAITATTSENTLAGAMTLTILPPTSTCATSNESDSAALYRGPLGNTSGLNILGNPATGPDPGDRTLAAGASETLCVIATLPLAAPNTAEGTSTTLTLTVNAEQTANNNTPVVAWPAQPAAAPANIAGATLLSTSPGSVQTLATDGTTLYATTSSPSGVYYRALNSTGAWTALSTGITNPLGTLIFNGKLYVGDSTGNIYEVNKTTGAAILRVSGLIKINEMSTDGTALYTTDGNGNSGAVHKVTMNADGSLTDAGIVWNRRYSQGIAADSSGDLYEASPVFNDLYKFNAGVETQLPMPPTSQPVGSLVGGPNVLYSAVIFDGILRYDLTTHAWGYIISQHAQFRGLVTDGTYLYTATSSNVYRIG